jgi:hypothetical protein
MAHYAVVMPHQTFEFDGKRIAGPVSTRLGDSGWQRPRWVEMIIYRTRGGMYVVDRTMHTVVAHEENAPCVPAGKAGEKGLVVPVSQLPADVVACNVAGPASRGRCYPDLSRGVARLEQPQVTVFKSVEAADVIRWLSAANYKAGGTSDMMSRPVAALLEQAQRKDRNFRIHPVITIA